MAGAPSVAPFRFRDGRLLIESVALADLAAALEGRAAWVLGHRAVDGALRRAARAAGGAVTVAVGALGPRELLALAAQAGCWARATSSHELLLACAAGFAPGRTVVGAPVLEDGVVRDALAAGVAAIEARGDEARNVERIARALGHAPPPAGGAPPNLPEGALRRAGGLLAPLLSGAPGLAVDAVWAPRGRGRVTVAALAGPAETLAVTGMRGLSGPPAPARLLGAATRGDWVVLPDTRAAQVHLPDPAHPLPAVVMVRGGAWRTLDRRPWPGEAAVPVG